MFATLRLVDPHLLSGLALDDYGASWAGRLGIHDGALDRKTVVSRATDSVATLEPDSAYRPRLLGALKDRIEA